MDINESVINITNKLVFELQKEKPSNLLMAVRNNYDFWQQELILLLKQRNISIHNYLSILLVECGYKNATPDKIRSYMNKVKNDKKLEQTKLNKTLNGISNKIDILQDSAMVSPNMVLSALKGSNVNEVVRVPVVVSSVLSKPFIECINAVFDLDEFPFKEQTERLKIEINNFYENKFIEWSNADDELLAVFSQISNNRFIPMVKMATAFTSNENHKQACWGAFKIKCNAIKFDLSKHGYI